MSLGKYRILRNSFLQYLKYWCLWLNWGLEKISCRRMEETGACQEVLIATKCRRINVAVSLSTTVTVIKSKIRVK
jgi:hypothetical protein